MRIAFEIEHRVDDVLEHARAGDRAFLRHVADEEDGDAGCLASRVSCAAHSRTCATEPGADVQRLGVQRLDRIDDGDRAASPSRSAARMRSSCDFGEQLQRGAHRAPRRCARSATCCADSSPVT